MFDFLINFTVDLEKYEYFETSPDFFKSILAQSSISIPTEDVMKPGFQWV